MTSSPRVRAEYGVRLDVLPSGDIVARIDASPLEEPAEVVIEEENTLP